MQYELLYIIPATFTDDEIGGVESNVKNLLEKYGASVTETKRLGKFRLAYPIKNVRYGHYILVNLTTETPLMAKLEESLRISKDVLRHLILKAEEAGSGSFELVQFQEVEVDTSSGRGRRRREAAPKDKSKVAEEIKSGVAVIEAEPGEKSEEKTEAVPVLSDEELDKKIDQALTSEAAPKETEEQETEK
ncbi:MAG: 30S ribosomal protein S6 [Patescibacteria group bacterium]